MCMQRTRRLEFCPAWLGRARARLLGSAPGLHPRAIMPAIRLPGRYEPGGVLEADRADPWNPSTKPGPHLLTECGHAIPGDRGLPRAGADFPGPAVNPVCRGWRNLMQVRCNPPPPLEPDPKARFPRRAFSCPANIRFVPKSAIRRSAKENPAIGCGVQREDQGPGGLPRQRG